MSYFKRRTALYRCYNKQGELLYVGISATPLSRFNAHRSGGEWIFKCSRVDLEWFADRDLAKRAETIAIVKECPPHNIAEVPQKRKPLNTNRRYYWKKKPVEKWDEWSSTWIKS